MHPAITHIDGQLTWNVLSATCRTTSVDNRYFLATRGSRKKEWILTETQRCMYQHGSSLPVDGSQRAGISTQELTDTVLAMVKTHAASVAAHA